MSNIIQKTEIVSESQRLSILRKPYFTEKGRVYLYETNFNLLCSVTLFKISILHSMRDVLHIKARILKEQVKLQFYLKNQLNKQKFDTTVVAA